MLFEEYDSIYHLEAEEDGDLYANTGYNQILALHNMLLDAAETVEEHSRNCICIIDLEGGVYDFYAGYADRANGSGIPLAMPVADAGQIVLRGLRDGTDETVLRLHGKMQWLKMLACRNLELSNLRIEYADDLLFSPKANPHLPPIYPTAEPDEDDRAVMLFDDCEEVTFRNVSISGKGLQVVFRDCNNMVFTGVTGSAGIFLKGCEGILVMDQCDIHTEISGLKEDRPLIVMPDGAAAENGILSEGSGTDPQPYVPPKQPPVLVTDIFTGERKPVGGDPELSPVPSGKPDPETTLY